MQHIIEGFLSFQKEIFPQRKELFRSLASSQNPKALFISCSDSRLVPELVTQQEPGQLFVIRNAGNIVPPFGPEPGGVSATIEYAVVALGVTDIVICGHSNCGAMKAIADNANLEPMPAVSHWLRYSDAAKAVVEKKSWDKPIDKVNAMVQENVFAQLSNIKTHPSVAVGLRNNSLRLHGWVYDIESGKILALDKATKTFVSLSENPEVFFVESRVAGLGSPVRSPRTVTDAVYLRPVFQPPSPSLLQSPHTLPAPERRDDRASATVLRRRRCAHEPFLALVTCNPRRCRGSHRPSPQAVCAAMGKADRLF